VAEADLHSACGLRTRYLSGLEGWLAGPGSPVVLPPARWKIVVISVARIVPLLEAVNYLLAPHLDGIRPEAGR
jgi:antibiotic biosynthesis monooxygenase (ABM) superfamily enzyme